MRLRYKKHLIDRVAEASAFLIDVGKPVPDSREITGEKVDFSAVFGNENPVYLEIGCGKGGFALEYAKTHPDHNLVAVEKVKNVIVVAMEGAMRADPPLPNLRFMNCSAEYLANWIKEGSVSGIFLNFSCPYPKNTYANRRLTHRKFLEKYKRWLAPGGKIEQKTDNAPFFAYSLEEYAAAGYTADFITYDLYAGDTAGNIPTEYERMFRDHTPIKKTVQTAPAADALPSEKVRAYIAENLTSTVRPPKDFLPKPFSVPCTETFDNFFYWDTYFTDLAFLELGNPEQVKNNLDNFAAEIDRFGFIPNADHLTDRSQPPLFCRAVYDLYIKTGDVSEIFAYLPYIKRELDFWENRRKASGLYGWGGGKEEGIEPFARYVCDRLRVPEKEGDALKKQGFSFMSIAESGWDFNYRYGKDFDATAFAAVDLTSLLYDAWEKYAILSAAAGDMEEADAARKNAEDIALSMSAFLAEDGFYYDKNEETGAFSSLFSAASLYPYAVGAVEGKCRKGIDRLLYKHGLSVTPDRGEDDYLQWDFPMMWPPTVYFSYMAAKMTGDVQKQAEISNKYCRTVETAFIKTGRLWEKYDVRTGEPGAGVEYETPPMFGWTAGVYLFLQKEREERKK